MGIRINLFTNKNKHKQKKDGIISKLFTMIGEIITRVIVVVIVIAIFIAILWVLNPSFISFLI